MSTTATYTETGNLSIDQDGTYLIVGTYDADGADWIAPIDTLLAEAGYVRTGDWSEGARGDDTAPVRRV